MISFITSHSESKHRPTMKKKALLALTALNLLVLSLSSCANRPDLIKTDDSLAAVEIRNSTETDIRYAVIETFLTNGYQRESHYGLTFIKKGNILRQVEYASYMGGAARMRVKVRIDPISASSHLVKINAYTMTNQGSRFGDQERKVRGLRKGHYKNLLQEVSDRLQQY